MKRFDIEVNGMMSEGCESRIRSVVKHIKGVENVKANCNTGIVNVMANNDVNETEIKEKIEEIGYKVK